MRFKFLLLFMLFGGFCSNAFGQTYESAITAQQDITGYGQTFTFSFTGLPAGGWGDAQLVVYYSGDYGDQGEYNDVQDEDANYIGVAGPYNSGNDCDGEDSVVITFDATMIDTWMADSQVDFVISPSGDVDPGNCSELYLKCKLVYNYCVFGTPQAFASITLSEDLFCSYDDPMTLVGTPAGGTWSGTGVSGNMFDPSALSPGAISTITYTATDAIGCVTSSTESVRIKRAPSVEDTYACPGGTAELSVNSGGTYVWFEDNDLTQIIDTAGMITTPELYQTTSYYVAGLYSTSTFFVDSIGMMDSMVVDHDILSGDDRGGIAITPDYVYVVGDNNTVRADAADLSNMVSLPVRDGIFSDLGTGDLYSLWNIDADDSPNGNNGAISITAIRGMDENLEFTDLSPLSMEIPSDYGSVVLAGNGFVGIISAADNHAYVIDLDDYSVLDLGAVTGLQNYGSENWADWGVLEYDGLDFSALYTTYSNYQIVRHNLTTNVIEDVSAFPSDLSDMATFTISPWNNRWYFHYEGSSTVFGGNSETMGYANAGSTSELIENGELGCYSEAVVSVSTIELGSDTTACEYNVPIMLFAGNGFESYTWNGENNDYNVFAAMQSGEYIVEAVDEHNCDVTDTINVILDECLGVEEQSLFSQIELYPNPTSGDAKLNIVSAVAISAEYMLIDLSGNVLFGAKVDLAAGENSLDIQTNTLASGVYLIRLSDTNGRNSLVRVVKN